MNYLQRLFIAILLALNCLLPIVAAEEAISIPETHQAILKGDWTPTKQETDEALAAAIAFVRALGNQPMGGSSEKKYKHEGAFKISSGIADYAMQFVGRTKKGKKIIFCNFFPSRSLDNEFKDWKNSLPQVDGGGYNFWRIDFNLREKSCDNFQINGPE